MVCGGGKARDGQLAVAEGAATVLRDWTGNDSASVTSAIVFFSILRAGGCADRPAVRSRRSTLRGFGWQPEVMATMAPGHQSTGLTGM